ncbi:hypothetical protein GCM10008107_29230 [Psychrosphaera saromensis]|jgi:hypothetical protein|uniref:DUF3081 domain-containing protein n=1 Tax=Psychrosphaera saromensis TaxID=716813 RepID=A0A2S7USH6_9GAMM|nr:DUF3081 family protein [Psychrosphaera saromensis]PQJ52936.1 hypothetical protein BTO11_04215 [Psychrosphaera saromensis]GHB77782.1 hypothetical protein GCM10008107_29230 [Psychrosphaera saromensis]GLQ12908.1 hypothetical protein GCM10007917_03630 [Psychrosphaera saromensis]
MTYVNYLELFNHVITHGTKQDSKSVFEEFSAWNEIDGYTCYLKFKDVTITLMFHSRFSFEYEQESELLAFQKAAKRAFDLIQEQRSAHTELRK